jgi:hypothetical protein
VTKNGQENLKPHPGPRPDRDPGGDRRVANVRADRGMLERALEVAGGEQRGTQWRCPFHPDGKPSGSIYLGDDGAYRYRCHAAECGVCEDVVGVRVRSSGRGVADILAEYRGDVRPLPGGAVDRADRAAPPPADPDRRPPPRVFPTVDALLASVATYAEVEASYAYADPGTGRVDLLVIRCRDGDGKKCYPQATPDPAGSGGFVMRGLGRGAAYPLYNRTRLARRPPAVVVVEGEKCVEALQALGVVATTAPMGAGKARHADWSPLSGGPALAVYLWPDNDAAGAAHMRDVAEILSAQPDPPRVYRVDPATLELPEKGDAVDFVAAIDPSGDFRDAAAEAVRTVLSRAEPIGPAAKVRRLLAATIDGTRRNVPFPWPVLTRQARALLPGMVTVLCGAGGSTKTYWLLQACRHWHRHGVPWAMQALEEHEDGSHLWRALAQEDGNGDLLDDLWVRGNPADAMAAQERHAAFLDSFGRHLSAVPGSMPSLSDLTDWVRDRVRAGCRVIAIDPITAAESTDKPWLDDKAFIRNSQSVCRDGGASLILVTHPKKGSGPARGGPPSMDDLAGGAAYGRHTQAVLWMKFFDEPRQTRCSRWLAGQEVQDVFECNRSLRLLKATNGPGTGSEIGCRFDPATRSFTEYGVVVRDGQDGGNP